MAILLPRLIATLETAAPGVNLSTRHLLPMTGLEELETGALDVMVLPLDEVPARFSSRVLTEEEFEIAAHASHPFLRAPTLRSYCGLLHLVVSISGDQTGYIDRVLAEKGLSRRVALSVPSFMLALATLAETELVAAVPGSLVRVHAQRFGVASVRAPLPLKSWQLRVIATKAAMADAGVAWLFEEVVRAGSSVFAFSARKRPRGPRRPAP
jgi:DNA-binding transcriptional LysR family regulator